MPKTKPPYRLYWPEKRRFGRVTEFACVMGGTLVRLARHKKVNGEFFPTDFKDCVIVRNDFTVVGQPLKPKVLPLP